MPDRLSSLDLTFLKAESPATPMHVGTVDIFEPPVHGDDEFDYESLVALIRDRIAYVPRYRQRVQQVPGRFAGPVWVDDEDFDVTYHVRRSALPRPGTHAQLRELVARLQSRRLDRNRPLWEIYLVEGLEEGRVAVITKTHHAMVDGVSAVDIGTVILDLTPTPREVPEDDWTPHKEPGAASLMAGAVADLVRRPTEVLDTARVAASDAKATVGKVAGIAGGILQSARTMARSAPSSPLNATISEQRRFGMARTDL